MTDKVNCWFDHVPAPPSDKAIAARLRAAYRAIYQCEIDLDDDELVAEFEMHDCNFGLTLEALSQ